MSVINAKRMRMMKQIRNEHIKSYMKKVRFELIQNLSNEALNALISQTNQSITHHQFQDLIEFANQDKQNAIIHIGNLLIDGVLETDDIANAKLSFGTNMYWSWLIRVIIDLHYCDQKLLAYCKKLILKGKSNSFQVQNGLYIFKMIAQTQNNEVIAVLAHDIEFVTAIVKYTFNPQQKISYLSYSILSSLISSQQDMVHTFQDQKQKKTFILSIKQGLIKQKSQIRASACRISINLLLSNIQIDQITEKIFLITQSQKKDRVQVQISYFWFHYLKQASISDIICLIQKGLLIKLDRLFENSSNKETQQNCLKSLIFLGNRIKAQIPDLLRSITEQIKRLDLFRQLQNFEQNEQD